jgi:hypothetical protein
MFSLYLKKNVILGQIIKEIKWPKNVILWILGQIIKEIKWPRLPLFICDISCQLIVACVHAHAHIPN